MHTKIFVLFLYCSARSQIKHFYCDRRYSNTNADVVGHRSNCHRRDCLPRSYLARGGYGPSHAFQTIRDHSSCCLRWREDQKPRTREREQRKDVGGERHSASWVIHTFTWQQHSLLDCLWNPRVLDPDGSSHVIVLRIVLTVIVSEKVISPIGSCDVESFLLIVDVLSAQDSWVLYSPIFLWFQHLRFAQIRYSPLTQNRKRYWRSMALNRWILMLTAPLRSVCEFLVIFAVSSSFFNKFYKFTFYETH